MSPVTRYLVMVLVRLLLVGAAGWFAFEPESLGAGAPVVSRIAIVLSFLLLSILLGELDRLRTHFALLLSALRGGDTGTAGAAAHALNRALEGGALADMPDSAPATPPDERNSIDILVKALRTRDPDTRARVHSHLKRLTGRDLPADTKAWAAWWAKAREGYAPDPKSPT